MAIVEISDPQSFNQAVGILLTRGGTFETRAVGVLVVNGQQLEALRSARLIERRKSSKVRANGKKKAKAEPVRSRKASAGTSAASQS